MKKMLLMIINPRSGRNKINDDLLEATNIFGMEGYGITVLNTTKAGDATTYAREFGKDYDIVICRGGDGTFCEMMNGIMDLEKKPLIGYPRRHNKRSWQHSRSAHESTQSGSAYRERKCSPL